MSFGGAANATNAIRQIVSEGAVQSVRDGVLQAAQEQARPANPVVEALQNQSVPDARQRQRRDTAERRRLWILHVHAEQVRKRNKSERLQLLVISSVFLLLGFCCHEEKKNEPAANPYKPRRPRDRRRARRRGRRR